MMRSVLKYGALLLTALPAVGDSTISSTAKHAYGANIGWINFEGDQTNGVVVGAAFLSRFAWSANCGWINFGDGSPDNGLAYSNISASDFGVNHDGAGNLTGSAYGASIGWITFEQTHGQPRISLSDGQFSGFAWSANCGWINLGTGDLATSVIDPGQDTDEDMIADAWELEQGAANGTPDDLTLLSKTGDADGDGVSDMAEYTADSNPFDPFAYLRITAFAADQSPDDNIFMEWTSSERRLYNVQKSDELVAPFADVAGQTDIDGDPADTSTFFTDPLGVKGFFRIEAKVPLEP